MSRGIPAHENLNKTKGQLVLHGEYSSMDSCLPKIPAVFGGTLKNILGVSKFVFVYSTISRGILVDEHWFKVPVL